LTSLGECEAGAAASLPLIGIGLTFLKNPTDPRELGRKGGLVSGRSRSGLDELADDSLREKARQRLNAMLESPGERVRLSAARSLFTCAPTRRSLTG
jgi:hypothetical protein